MNIRTIAAALVAGALLSGAPAVARPTPEQSLAKLLEGRVAGEPERCIRMSTVRSTQIIDKTAIVYDAGSVRYVNRPASGAESLDRSDVLVTRTSLPELCNTDIVRLFDQGSRMQTGFVGLGSFVPYRKAPTGGQ